MLQITREPGSNPAKIVLKYSSSSTELGANAYVLR